jgi:hypothetical protein
VELLRIITKILKIGDVPAEIVDLESCEIEETALLRAAYCTEKHWQLVFFRFQSSKFMYK